MPLWQPMDAIARPAYYDRDAIPVFMNYNASVGPHGSTLRASYTPPFAYAAFIESLYMLGMRSGAAAPVGFTDASFRLTPFYGGTVIVSYLIWNNNTLYFQEKMALTSYGYMAYGDVIDFRTSDGSTGGTTIYALAMKGTEFLF